MRFFRSTPVTGEFEPVRYLIVHSHELTIQPDVPTWYGYIKDRKGNAMGNIGSPDREIILVPEPKPEEAPVQEPSPQVEPVREPARQPEKVPA